MSEHTLPTLDAVAILTAQNGYPPSVREVAAMMRRPTMSAYHDLVMLRRSGLLTWEDGLNRTYAVTEAGRARLSKVVRVG